MRSSTRRWLIIELLVCFLPCTLMLLLGATILPLQVASMPWASLNWEGPVLVFFSVVCGTIGLVTLLFVVSLLFNGREKIERPVPVLGGVLAGAAPLLLQAVLGLSEGAELLTFTATVWLPLLATAHILFLSRNLFIAGFRHGKRPLVSVGTWLTVTLVGSLAALLIVLRQGIDSTALEERRAYWMRHKPATYTYHSNVTGWFKPIGAAYPKQVWVAGSEVTAAKHTFEPFLLSSTTKPAPPEDGALTIDQIFDAMLDEKKRGARVHARFDPSTGAVLHVRVDHVAENADWDFEVREFRALDAGPSN